jgi:hypothetical protein
LNTNQTAFNLSQSIQSPVGSNSYFGASVSIHDDELIVGANGFKNSTGAAFVYRLTEGNSSSLWVPVAALQSTGGRDGNFGHSVSAGRNHVAVGAFGNGESEVF